MALVEQSYARLSENTRDITRAVHRTPSGGAVTQSAPKALRPATSASPNELDVALHFHPILPKDSVANSR